MFTGARAGVLLVIENKLKFATVRAMQFRIVTIGWGMVYVALAISSLRYPTTEIATAVKLLCVISIALAAVIAFDRKSTSHFAFVVFAIATATHIEFASQTIVSTMLRLGITTGSTEYANLKEMLYYHSVFAVGLFGFLFGTLLTRARVNDASKEDR